MNTSALKEGLHQLIGEKSIPYFVCSADNVTEIANFDKFPTVVIQNIDPADEKGTHWICWWVLSEMRSEYFDSFGLPITEYEDVKFPIKYIVHDNTRQIQSNESNYCGVWCLRFASDRSKGKSFGKFMEQWRYSGKYNEVHDRQIYKWIYQNTFMFKPETCYDRSYKNQTCCNYNDLKGKQFLKNIV